jgi:Carbohydrate binding domain
VEYKAGRQALRFDVRRCSPNGGWYSPGFSREFEATPGTTYTIGFWVKNDGAEFLVRVGGVSATDGAYETIVRSRATLASWTHHEHTYTVPRGYDRIRLEVNVVGPGTFWIDEVTIGGP